MVGGTIPASPWELKCFFNCCQRRLLGNVLLIAIEMKGERGRTLLFAGPTALPPWVPAHTPFPPHQTPGRWQPFSPMLHLPARPSHLPTRLSPFSRAQPSSSSSSSSVPSVVLPHPPPPGKELCHTHVQPLALQPHPLPCLGLLFLDPPPLSQMSPSNQCHFRSYPCPLCSPTP